MKFSKNSKKWRKQTKNERGCFLVSCFLFHRAIFSLQTLTIVMLMAMRFPQSQADAATKLFNFQDFEVKKCL